MKHAPDARLADRDIEFASLLGLVQPRQRPGDERIALIEGPSGSGKTALLDALVAAARDSDTLVLYVACSESEQHLQGFVVRQLILAHGLTVDRSTEFEQLDQDTLAAMLRKPGQTSDPALRRATTQIQDNLAALLSAWGTKQQTLIVIDDVQYIDELSAGCLLHVARRLRHGPVSFALAQVSNAGPNPLGGPLKVESDYRLITLASLPKSEVGRLLRGDGLDDAATTACYARTGGNPMLVRAWAEDRRRHDRLADNLTSPARDAAYRSALSRCLRRAPAPTQRLAQAMAVLGPQATVAAHTQLLGLPLTEVMRGTVSLTEIGLLDDGQFRHPDIPAAILNDMAPADRGELHARAAELLVDQDVQPRFLAEQLLQARTTRMPWAVTVLTGAALQAATECDLPFANACLDLASRDGRNPGMVSALMLDLAWLVDPVEGDRYVNRLRTALLQGELDVSQAEVLVRHQLWHGRLSDAADLITRLLDRIDDGSPDDAHELATLRQWLSHACPNLAGLIPASHPAVSAAGRESRTTPLTAVDVRARATAALADVLHNRPSGQMVIDARLVLRSRNRDQPTFAAAYDALQVLVHSDALIEATQRCAVLLDAVPVRTMPTLHALLTATKAEIHRRCGDLPGAQQLASTALEQISESAWGVNIVRPLGTLILTLVAMQRIDAAESLVDRRIPPAASLTAPGLAYRYAVGVYKAAAKLLDAAQVTFQQCGKLAHEWNLDMPTLAPWRSGLAEIHMQMGRPEHANQLLIQQLRLLRGRYPRSRGMTLRQLAGTVEIADRKRLLASAMELLDRSGDCLELAIAQYELGVVEFATGSEQRARLYTQVAMETAAKCGVPLLPLDEPTDKSVDAHHGILTRAELRVAMMAARGYTNRQIAEQLSVTPSTVEQHLTRVFRKLNVKQRKELLGQLGLTAASRPLL